MPLKVTGALLHARHVEHGPERHALPVRIAHRAVAQLPAGDAGLEEAAAVARALVDCGDLDRRQLLDVGQRDVHGLVDLAPDLHRERAGVDFQGHAGEVVADEEGVVRRDGALIEDLERGLELRRPRREADHRGVSAGT